MTELLLIAPAVFLLAGTIKGTFGIGMPTASISLLVQFVEPRTAVVVVVLPILFSNAWQMYRCGDVRATLRRLWPLATALALCLLTTALLATTLSGDGLALALGGVIALFALTSLLANIPALPVRFDRPAQCVAGTLAGVMGGLTAIWAPPMVIYLLARRVDKDDFVRAVGLLLFTGSVPLALGYWQNGLLAGELAWVSALMIVPTVLGFSIGEHIRRRLDAERFRKGVLIFFLLMGLNLIRRALF